MLLKGMNLFLQSHEPKQVVSHCNKLILHNSYPYHVYRPLQACPGSHCGDQIWAVACTDEFHLSFQYLALMMCCPPTVQASLPYLSTGTCQAKKAKAVPMNHSMVLSSTFGCLGQGSVQSSPSQRAVHIML